jgi:predicted ATPase/class 3 adenylate cyclase
MDLYEIIDRVVALLQQRGRLAYRALQYQFKLDEEGLEALKAELIDGQRVAVDEGGKVLVWTGDGGSAPAPTGHPSHPRSPASYTPSHLAERIRAEQAAMEARGAAEGERKTITALFADIKGSMALMEDLDPEDARTIIDPVLALMMDAVHRYEGYVAQSTGDGIFAFFGAPLAHEDHPQRALFAALRMQEDMKRYAERLRREKGCNVEIRVGVNTGDVVLRSIRKDDLHTEYTPISHSTSLASRLESLAPGGSIAVSEHTYRLAAGYFEFKPLGAARVKGVSEPINIYEVRGIGPLRTRLQVAASHGLTRFVGRQQAQSGQGQIVGVVGEPGVGKSRLFHEFVTVTGRSPVPQSRCLILETFSVSHSKAYPYLPLLDLLKNYFQIAPQDDDRRRREKITGRVLTLDRSLEDTLPYLFTLFGIAEPGAPLQHMDPQIRKQRTFEAIKRLLTRESLNQPLILVFEDLHWLDAETQAFLTLLSESLATTKILLLVNYRPEYRHDWGGKTYYTQLRLDPFGRADAQALLTTLLGDGAPLHPLKEFILEKTEGNPFFMEEIVQALREQGMLLPDPAVGAQLASPSSSPGRASLALADLHLPPTVQGILASRIDRLPQPDKELLQTLSVLGKEFSLSLIQQVVGQSENTLRPLLSHLQGAEFIYEQPAFPEVEYTFKHALTQEVAYGSLLLERRKVLHERAAQAIEALFHSQLEDHYGDLARHYSRSGNTQKAVDYLNLAGQQAVQRSANTEAISHLNTALAFLQTLPDTPERAQQELTLQVALGVPLQATKGSGAAEVERVYTRARELCQQLGETPQLFPVVVGLGVFYLLRGELRTTHELAEQLLSLARRVHDPALLLQAHRAFGTSLCWRGEFIAAQMHLEQAIALYTPQLHRPHAFFYGFDPAVVLLSLAAHVLWFLGYPDQALKKSQEALTLAQELSHPHSLAFALTFTARMHHFRREAQAARESAEALLTLATEQGFAQWKAHAPLHLGEALAEQGKIEEGIAQIRQGMAAYRATGAELGRTYYLAWLAQALGKIGQAKDGLEVLTEALEVTGKTEERHYEAELYRLKGELTLQSKPSSPQSQVEEAEACFHKAIEIARRQQAKSLELRAAMSLARLWQRQGKQHEAHQLLAEIYGWFTEGFDTKDLQEAKALLEKLA